MTKGLWSGKIAKIMAAEIDRLATDLAERYPQVAAQLYEVAAFARRSGVSEEPSKPGVAVGSQSLIETSRVVVTPALQDRQLRGALLSFVQEYRDAKVCTPELVNHTWQNMWRVIGQIADFTYQVPACDRTEEELAQLQEKNRAALLLPSDIYTPDGLVRLGRAFPLMRSWTTDPKEVARISHGSNTGGCIDIEMSLDAPYRTSRGYNQKGLVAKIAADARAGQRLPTYFVGSQFSHLLTGHYFDENTWSRLPESFSGGSLLDAHFYSDGGVSVLILWSAEGRSPVLGGRSEGVKRA